MYAISVRNYDAPVWRTIYARTIREASAFLVACRRNFDIVKVDPVD